MKNRGGVPGVRADLHTHSTCSDGALAPRELVKRAAQAGIGILSITDHDSVDGLDEALEAGKTLGVSIVPGIELTAMHHRKEIHILGYFIDHRNEQFSAHLSTLRQERVARAGRIVAKLNKMKIPITMESILAVAGGGAVCRPHIATALVNGGFVESYDAAFRKYLGDGRPACEKRAAVEPSEVIRRIALAGGLSFLAHPGLSVSDLDIESLIEDGLNGIEVVHPSHSPALMDHFRGIIDAHALLESGGSDFHGGLKRDDDVLGNITVPAETVEKMRPPITSN